MENQTNPPTIMPSGLVSRRSALRLLAFAGAGLLAGTEKSSAFFNFFNSLDQEASPTTLKGLGISDTWIENLGPTLPSYVEYIRRINLKNITVHQVVEPHAKIRGSVHNSLPPKAIWGNIRATLKVIDALADRLDMPVKSMISVYRSPAYNARCPGAKSNSYHTRNFATDVTFDCSPGKVTAMARAMRTTGLFKGGVGKYPGFTHVDTRGRNADW